MVDLTDIARDASETVHGLTVRGLSFEAIADLFARFPELRSLLEGTAPKSMKGVGAVIASGTGFHGDAKQEAAANTWPVDTQLDLLGPIVRLTIGKKGPGPFTEKLTEFLRGGAAAEGGPEQPIKIRSAKLRAQPNGSLRPDTQPEASGA